MTRWVAVFGGLDSVRLSGSAWWVTSPKHNRRALSSPVGVEFIMELKRLTFSWPAAIPITLVVALGVSAPSPVRATGTPMPVQSVESPPVTLRLHCVDRANVRFEITNIGATDTSLPLGMAVGNGQKYMINDLHLRIKPLNGNANGAEFHYWPRDYPSAIGGRLDQWFQAFPVGAVFRMSAKAEDFWLGRYPSFTPGLELSLRWNIAGETPKDLFPLVYWTGTLISNSCTVP
jgi:hypothetical protein